MNYRSVTLALLLGATGAQAESARIQFNSNIEPISWSRQSGTATLLPGSAPVRPRRSEAPAGAGGFDAILPAVSDGLAEELERRLDIGGEALEELIAPEAARGDEVAVIRSPG